MEEKPSKSGAVTPTPTAAAAAAAAAAVSSHPGAAVDTVISPPGGLTPKRRDSSAVPSDTTTVDVPTVIVNGKDGDGVIKMTLSSAVAAVQNVHNVQNVVQRSGSSGVVDLDFGPPSEHVENYKTIQQILTR